MNQDKAIHLCREMQKIAESCRLNVGLTGGCLYKTGERKDMDMIVYPHNSAENADPEVLETLLQAFIDELENNGWKVVFSNKWLRKLEFIDGTQGIDLFWMQRTGGNTAVSPTDY